ncbi:hypothetical protein [Cellvibrio sp. PSBB006]|uniref:hypothetical protein n=1 Tax=Cellvibrio sp. PSBB006 TaxID=1987723 RepID=UPI000B3B28C6|nr:hypothetical protein [Cellvibrio sp. PSBB006]ARU27963.1 hypothetical protein CBR65_11275 [Cellvibrio sp. PSBB006]
MTIRLLTIIATLLLSLHVPLATALTMEQFSNICKSSPVKCSDHPTVQAYVGGALDLLATLDERTDYLQKVYCKAPKELFDVPAIIRFMEQRSEQYRSDNAMLVLIRYFEERGGCNHE